MPGSVKDRKGITSVRPVLPHREQQQAAAGELSGDCDPAVKPGGLLCCSNLKSASEETYLLLGNVILALLILGVKILSFNAVYILVPVAGSSQSL